MRPRHWVTAGAGSCSEAAADAGVCRTGRTERPGEASLSENMAWENLQKVNMHQIDHYYHHQKNYEN